AEHYESAHVTARRDQSPLAPPRFLSAPTALTRGSQQTHTLEIRADGGDTASKDAALHLELRLRCETSRIALGKQPVQAQRAVFAFVTPADAILGTCQLEAELSGLGKTSVTSRVDVLVRSEVTLQVSRVHMNDATASVELLAQAGADPPTGALEATRGPSVIGSVPLHPKGATPFEVPLLAQPSEVLFRVVPGSAEFIPGAPVTVSLPAQELSQPGWLWHSIGALCFLAWLTWRWLIAAHPRARQAPPTHTPRTAHASAEASSSGVIRGSVFDVSTHHPLGAVELTLLEPRADGESVLERTVSNLHGEFRFSTQFSRQSLVRLRASHEHFMTLTSTVTAAEFVIELRSTRRA
ncbi:MAG TPA: hypothetical protein VN764_12890, partial [Polyangiaceae bacterium]|nr:hypothetical protein [Polyangiaceae bacterium]